MMELKINAKTLKEKRIHRSWTQEELAERAGIHTRTLQRVESLGLASKSTLRALAQALEVDIADLQIRRKVTLPLLEPGLALLVWAALAWVFTREFADNPAALAGGREILALGGLLTVFIVPLIAWCIRHVKPGRNQLIS